MDTITKITFVALEAANDKIAKAQIVYRLTTPLLDAPLLLHIALENICPETAPDTRYEIERIDMPLDEIIARGKLLIAKRWQDMWKRFADAGAGAIM